MGWKRSLLDAVDSYCKATGRARSGVGKLIMNDTKFFDRIEKDSSCTIDTYEKVMTFLQENTPKKSKLKRSK